MTGRNGDISILLVFSILLAEFLALIYQRQIIVVHELRELDISVAYNYDAKIMHS